MKTRLIKSLLVSCILATSLLTPGCSSPVRTAYKVEKASVITVETALKSWGDYVSEYHPSAEDEQKVKNALTEYKKCAKVLVEATYVYKKALEYKNEKDEVEAKIRFNNALLEANVAITDFVALVNSYKNSTKTK